MHVDYDLAEILTEQWNSYALMMEGLEELEVDFVLEVLRAMFEAEDLKYLIEDEFGRGFVMGHVHVAYVNHLVDEAIENGTATEEQE